MTCGGCGQELWAHLWDEDGVCHHRCPPASEQIGGALWLISILAGLSVACFFVAALLTNDWHLVQTPTGETLTLGLTWTGICCSLLAKVLGFKPWQEEAP